MKFAIRLLSVTLLLCLTLFTVLLTVSLVQGTWLEARRQKGANRVAVVDVKGIIYSSATFTKRIGEILEDEHIKALVVRVNSPGGLVGPSQEIYDAIKKVDEKIPVVISIGALGASGGYYAALGGRKIWVNPGAMTASIGVIMEFANLERLYQWAKVERFALKAGKLKDVGSEARKMTPEEKVFLTELLDNVHKQFKAAVKERRKLPDEEIEKWCDGRVMTGQQAVSAKLADEAGGFDKALEDAKTLAALPKDAPVEYPTEPKKGILRQLILGGDSDEASESSSLSELTQALTGSMKQVAPGWQILLLAPVRPS